MVPQNGTTMGVSNRPYVEAFVSEYRQGAICSERCFSKIQPLGLVSLHVDMAGPSPAFQGRPLMLSELGQACL
jgi:hypothetical protein